MTNISSREFMNAYENFYKAVRMYLWPFDVLKQLGEVEADIYAVFIDLDKLEDDFSKLYASIRDVCKTDNVLAKTVAAIQDLINTEEIALYAKLNMVDEVNPNNDKVLTTKED